MATGMQRTCCWSSHGLMVGLLTPLKEEYDTTTALYCCAVLYGTSRSPTHREPYPALKVTVWPCAHAEVAVTIVRQQSDFIDTAIV
jgi:hypothetical protein